MLCLDIEGSQMTYPNWIGYAFDLTPAMSDYDVPIYSIDGLERPAVPWRCKIILDENLKMTACKWVFTENFKRILKLTN